MQALWKNLMKRQGFMNLCVSLSWNALQWLEFTTCCCSLKTSLVNIPSDISFNDRCYSGDSEKSDIRRIYYRHSVILIAKQCKVINITDYESIEISWLELLMKINKD